MTTLEALAVALVMLLAPVIAQADPSIAFRKVPAHGKKNGVLKGTVDGVAFGDHRVAVYIEVRGGWWNKPDWDERRTKIKKNGKWAADVTTGGIDELATTYVAYLIPKSCKLPRRAGEGTLPIEIEQVALARAEIARTPPL